MNKSTHKGLVHTVCNRRTCHSRYHQLAIRLSSNSLCSATYLAFSSCSSDPAKKLLRASLQNQLSEWASILSGSKHPRKIITLPLPFHVNHAHVTSRTRLSFFFQRVTLKSWEWPGYEAKMYTHHTLLRKVCIRCRYIIIVSVTVKLFDPLGVVSPVIILFKMFCQQLCEAKVGWDEPLPDDFLKTWQQLLVMLSEAKAISIPRCVYRTTSPKSARLIGFCDASAKAYAAVVYIKLEDEDDVNVKFIAAKTRVAPVLGVTIPRLELLSALLLSKPSIAFKQRWS